MTLLRLDVAFHGWWHKIHVRKSKPIQLREHTYLLPAPKAAHPALCTVYWAKWYFRETEAGREANALRGPKGEGLISYTISILPWNPATGVNLLHFSTHNLRRGGVHLSVPMWDDNSQDLKKGSLGIGHSLCIPEKVIKRKVISRPKGSHILVSKS